VSSGASSNHPLFRLISYLSSYRGQIHLGIFYSITNKLFDLAPPILIGAAVDVVVSKESSFVARLGVEDISSQLWLLALFTLIIWGCESVMDYLADVLWRELAQEVQHELRLDAFSHLQTLELAYFENRASGDLMAVLNDDVNQLERFLDGGAHEIITLMTTIVVVGGLFVYLVPSIAWMALVPMPFVAWGSLYFQRKVAPRYQAVREQAGHVNAQLANVFGGIATVKSFTSEAHERARIEGASTEYSRRNQMAIRISSAFVPCIRMIIVLGFAAIMVYGGEMAIAGTLNVGAYSIRAMASVTRVLNVFEVEAQIVDGTSASLPEKVRGDISFEDVGFSYMERDPIIENFSLRIESGQTVGIVGSTGSGKTTLVKLLLRFYDCESGRILIDDIPIKELRLEDLRGSIALVSQDVFLVDGTVRDNVAYGTFEASDDEVRKAAQIAEVHDFIESLPKGYDTLVGERGQKLSGGQRQRISIARAVLKDAPIVILDEATSSVDNETEAAIQRALNRLASDRTMIVIAHRLSTVRNADNIFVLEDGQLKQSGSHDDLIQQDGLYRALWQVQTGEFAKVGNR
jgi:ATP-binding cassette subfamily B protein